MSWRQDDSNAQLLEAISRIQKAYFRHKNSYLTLNYLLESLLQITGSDCGFVGEYSRDNGRQQVSF